ncbi:MAG: hypothetical protein REI96_06215 [Flavobacterium nitrogenifigens]|uniref:hypothetical protein n=1 Tax=Flavobacterium nitrogenifigens TaxID=1617283 RepID=UPI002808E48E|nr:hypothetical protein [Flavobacterium nitrogenifigens]MDQ8012021.1 hypothetical protein [Flavobacterium nitrogenifigens]
MSKQFAKVTKTYSTKNKLQQILLTDLNSVDFTLYPNRESAKKSIELIYQNAISIYKGKAAVPKLQSFEPHSNKNELIYFIDEVIYISLYKAKIDLT